PKFFAGAIHENREQQNDEIPLESEETRDSRKPDILRLALRFLVRCWRIRLRVHVSLVLVRGRGRNSLRCASNFHTSRGPAHRRRPRWLYCRSQRRIVDLDLSGAALVSRTMESKIQRRRF